MPTSVIELGAADLHSCESGIRVELKSSAEFASSAEDGIDGLRQRLTAARVADQSNGKPWISRGHGFHLTIALHFGALLDTHDQDEIVEDLSEKMQVAKIWKQLRLTPSSVQSSVNGESEAFVITTHLTYDDSTPPSRRRLHKLGADVPFHDVRPSPGVTEVSCEAVHLSLALTHRRRRKRKRGRALEPADIGECDEYQEIIDSSQEEILEESGLSFPYDGTAADEHSTIFLSESGDWHLDAQFKHESDELDADELDADELEADELDMPCTDELAEAINPARYDFVPEISNTLPCDPEAASVNVATTTEGCVRVIEAAFQLAICGSSHHSQSDIRVLEKCSVCPLADAMPSIWSRDHLPSVASRAVFIPTVAHALESVLERTADRADAVGSQPREGTSQGQECKGSLVRSQLWKRMQHLLHSKNAAGRLSLLCQPADDGSGDYATIDKLLDRDEAFLDGLEMLDAEGGCDLVEDEWDDLLLGDDIGDYPGDDEGIVDSDLDDGALADDLEERPGLDNIDSGPPHQVFDLDDGYRSSTLDDLAGEAKAVETFTWQGGESKLDMSASQSSTVPSQSRASTGDRTSCKTTKQPVPVSGSRGSLLWPDEEGRYLSMRENLMFENSDGDEMLITETDLQSIPFEDCEMLCI